MKYIQFDDKKELDLILLGRIAVDFNPIDYFQPLANCKEFRKYLGGSPANVAVGLARLGGKVGFIGTVSDDAFGEFVTNFFNQEKIDTSHVFKAKNGEKIGLTFTEILSPTESSILMYRDGIADLQLSVDEVDEEYIAKSKAILISGTALAQSPSREAALKAAILAKKRNVKIVFDIDYRPYNWKNKDEICLYYSQIANISDIIMGSREEYDLTTSIYLDKNISDNEIAKYFFDKSARIVIIKHGKKGSTAHLYDGNAFTVKPFPITAFKSFGGGDGYGSAFLKGLFDGLDIPRCLEMGSASASMLVSAHGCSEFMPTLDELKTFIKDEKEKFGEMVGKD